MAEELQGNQKQRTQEIENKELKNIKIEGSF